MKGLSFKSLAVLVGLSFLVVILVKILNPKEGATPSSPESAVESVPADSVAPGGENKESSKVQETSATKKATEHEFLDVSERVLAGLPTFADIKGLKNEDVHAMPAVLREAGVKLGEVSQLIHDQPEFSRAGLDFYRSCFERDDVPEQLRALCVANFRNLNAHIGNRDLDLGSMVPSNVMELSNVIPRGW
ncbi:hypothetical protein D3C87_257870 [compost metagenome]